jgi:RNA polymerase sigma-70 factor (sigma-B/F/G subfamily)
MVSISESASLSALHHGHDNSDGMSAQERAAATQELLVEALEVDPVPAEALREEAVLLNVGVATSLAMRYHGRGVPDDDLVQTAYLGLVKAARAFDPKKSPDFLRFAVPTILGEVKRYFRDHAWTVKPPRRIQELQPQIWAASERFSRAAGRVPTTAELGTELGVTAKDVEESLAANKCFAPDSIDYTGVNDAEGACLADSIGDDDPGYGRAEALVALTPLCRQLSERDRRVVYLRYFHEWTQARIAEEFGLTQMQISRLLSRVLRQLREGLVEVAGDHTTDGDDRAAGA